jgi:hypothetical protein
MSAVTNRRLLELPGKRCLLLGLIFRSQKLHLPPGRAERSAREDNVRKIAIAEIAYR